MREELAEIVRGIVARRELVRMADALAKLLPLVPADRRAELAAALREPAPPAPGTTVVLVGTPVLPLRDLVAFPGGELVLFVGRAASTAAISAAAESERELLLVAQLRPQDADVLPGDLHERGVLGSVTDLLRLPDGTLKLRIACRARARIQAVLHTSPYLSVEHSELADTVRESDIAGALAALREALADRKRGANRRDAKALRATLAVLADATDPHAALRAVADNLHALKLVDRQAVLAIDDVCDRIRHVAVLLRPD